MPNCYLYISRAMDRFDLAGHGEPVALFRRAGLEAALVIGVQTRPAVLGAASSRRLRDALRSAGVATRFAPLPASRATMRSSWTCKTFGAEIGAFLDEFLAARLPPRAGRRKRVPNKT